MEFSAVIIKLLENGRYSEIMMLAGMMYIILTNRGMQKQFEEVVQKVSEIDKSLTAQRAVDAALKDSETRKVDEIKELQERVRQLEMRGR